MLVMDAAPGYLRHMTNSFFSLSEVPERIFDADVFWEAKLAFGNYQRLINCLAGSKASPVSYPEIVSIDNDRIQRERRAYQALIDQARFFQEDLNKNRYEIRVLFPDGRELEALPAIFKQDLILNFRDSEAVSGSRLFTHVEVRKVIVKPASTGLKQPSISDELITFIASHTPPVGSDQPRMPKKRLEFEARQKFGKRMNTKLFHEAHVKVRGNTPGRPPKTI